MIAIRKPGAVSRRLDRIRKLVMSQRPRFEDSYSLGEQICEGSQGTVYRAYDVSDSNMNLAVKIVERKALTKTQETQIQREVAIMRDLAALENTNQVVDFFASSKKFYIVQPLARGGDVFDWVVKNGAYHEREARELAIKLLRNIQGFHRRGYIHRDMKPENLLLASKDNTSIRVADWGYADRFDPENLPTQKCGTPAYTAPEIIAGKPYNQAVDLWSTGAILYLILSGRPAFYSNDPDELFRKIQGGEFKFHEKQWKGIVSQGAMECVQGLLTVDPKSRWTADQALASEWLNTRRNDSVRSLSQ